MLDDISTIDTKIEIESIDGFIEKNGSIMIDNEVIYYESVTRGPDAIITPGVSYSQFNKKKVEYQKKIAGEDIEIAKKNRAAISAQLQQKTQQIILK